jgi:hypothetical protein
MAVRQKTAMLLNHFKGRRALLLECFQAGDLSLMSLKQSITANIGEGRSEVEHFLLGEVQAVPELLQTATSIFDKQVHILSLQFIETSQLLFKFVDSAETTATVSRKESLAICFFDSKSLPEAFNISPELLDLALAPLLLLHQLVTLGHQIGQVSLVKTKLLWRLAVVFNNIGIGLHLRGAKLSPVLDDLL